MTTIGEASRALVSVNRTVCWAQDHKWSRFIHIMDDYSSEAYRDCIRCGAHEVLPC